MHQKANRNCVWCCSGCWDNCWSTHMTLVETLSASPDVNIEAELCFLLHVLLTLCCTWLCKHSKLCVCPRYRRVYHQTQHNWSLLLLSHRGPAVCFPSLNSPKLTTQTLALRGPWSNQTCCIIVILPAAQFAVFTYQMVDKIAHGWEKNGNLYSLFWLKESKHSPALLVCAANIYTGCKIRHVWHIPSDDRFWLHEHVSDE